MKVVIFSTATAYTGGAIITILNVLSLLQDKGVDPYFILKGHGPLEQVLIEKTISYSVVRSYDWCLPNKKIKGLKNKVIWKIKQLLNIIAEIQTAKTLKREKADLYHLNCLYNGTGVRAAKMLGIPVIWHFREFVDLPGETVEFVNQKVAWSVINKADIIVCVSEYLKKTYMKYIEGVDKIRVVYDGIDMKKFKVKSAKHIRNNTIVIGMPGTAEVKNHKDIIAALGRLKREGISNIILKIAGRWSQDKYNSKYLDSIKKLIVINNIKDNVEFIGMQTDMSAFWQSCDLAIICSKRESFGLAAVEAMACGIPLICSDTSISGELTDNGRNVWYYSTDHEEELAEQIKDCIQKLGTNEMGVRVDKAEKFVRDKFPIELSAEGLYHVYREAYHGNVKVSS